jgi:hypothetical protein
MTQKVPLYKNKLLEDLKGECWKEIPFTQGYYVVSNYGRVKALERQIITQNAPNGRWLNPRILSQWNCKIKNAYKGDVTNQLAVTFQLEGIRTTAMVRRLVYEAFLQPLTKEIMADKYVYPLDGNGLNCLPVNLGLATKKELRLLDLKNDRFIPPTEIMPKEFYSKNAKSINKLKRLQVKKYSADGLLKATYPSLTAAAKKNKVSVGCVALCVQKKLKKLKGFVYRYADESYGGEYSDWQGICKTIIRYSFDGKQIEIFPSISDAARKTQASSGDIIRCAKKITKQAGGFVWRYKGDHYEGEFKEELTKRQFRQCLPNGKEIALFNDISVAAEETNSSYEGIRMVLKNKNKSSNGFIWQYI